jgi:hypothetical protein
MGVTIATRLPVNILLPFNIKAIILTDYTSERQRSTLEFTRSSIRHVLITAKPLLPDIGMAISLNKHVGTWGDRAFPRYELQLGDQWIRL